MKKFLKYSLVIKGITEKDYDEKFTPKLEKQAEDETGLFDPKFYLNYMGTDYVPDIGVATEGEPEAIVRGKFICDTKAECNELLREIIVEIKKAFEVKKVEKNLIAWGDQTNM